jgi:hypothetical protein
VDSESSRPLGVVRPMLPLLVGGGATDPCEKTQGSVSQFSRAGAAVLDRPGFWFRTPDFHPSRQPRRVPVVRRHHPGGRLVRRPRPARRWGRHPCDLWQCPVTTARDASRGFQQPLRPEGGGDGPRLSAASSAWGSLVISRNDGSVPIVNHTGRSVISVGPSGRPRSIGTGPVRRSA